MEHFRVCIIGAGPTGLTAIKNVAAAGIGDIICHEVQDASGGIWAYSEDTARPSVYETAHTISSKRWSEFPDFRMPKDYPDYPSNRQILAYMRAYEAHFDLTQHIRFKSHVETVSRAADGRWTITVTGEEGSYQHTADYLLVCSGHHRQAAIPELPGDFSGKQMHSAQYRKADGFAGKRVLVVGGGNSACDIAVALSRVADHVSLSIRTPQMIIPKHILGRPVDAQFAKLHKPFTRWARNWFIKASLKLFVGPFSRYGLQQPGPCLLSSHPTLNTEVLDRIRHGKILPRTGIEEANGRTIRFADGTKGEFDLIIWATGYKLGVPILKDVCPDWSDATQVPLYLKMMPADISNLYFIGMIQPIGCIWVLAELQAKVAAAEISGAWKRPADMAARIDLEMRRNAKRYKASTRHAIQVDTYEYTAELKKILRAAGKLNTDTSHVHMDSIEA
ncbi:putative flavoprotein involved in K+ transport [Hoeflea sp. IMCC20628]|uniref:flavin-containing monooxygenase n=1 Tax=Hoeflea sp. IMCC20628 TaxID=1620421 RepID=UPI00063A8D53|nr:NAD(P)-binding domain-containing protein [Hoeflea sp. IMCC20628]AKI00320.1 putative flavoprotein involved in K+ transport [Hoeflea sp. IMCC20628]